MTFNKFSPFRSLSFDFPHSHFLFFSINLFPFYLETNIPGIFASGDVRSGATMQIASAVGEGATAALSIRHYLENNN